MNFEVKGNPYFLNFAPSEGRWFLYAPTVVGMGRIAVSDDRHMHFDRFVMPPIEEEATIV
jgi:hypothetical protein